ncbi:DUF4402 domain-containing protein [Sphingomicrobium nitratireducens]|uniref:DUF4402 domain-containing protein n=1 Tax=Sphingomicrobium nitratireducens TaxID=2964666 RepID=UPI00223F6428|nr:DUF4402 domain-containing protein [Sphingomicrobium nitratireducens]
MTLPATFLRLLLAAFLIGAPSLAHAQSVKASAKVSVQLKKPVVLTKLQDLDFGLIVGLQAGASPTAVTMTRDGTLTCPVPLRCSGAPLPGLYNIMGSNSAQVSISVTGADLVNAVSGATIGFTADGPTLLQLPNSGNKGVDFGVGGTIVVPSDAAGDYEGVITVTADYL